MNKDIDSILAHCTDKVAFIREAECIGCVKCIAACPFDTIMGTAKRMHTVLTDECTGCELCVPSCPVDCIEMVTPRVPQDRAALESKYRARFQMHEERLAEQRRAQRKLRKQVAQPTADDRKAYIEAAISRRNQKC
jgi:electron transport complex protein RnfB